MTDIVIPIFDADDPLFEKLVNTFPHRKWEAKWIDPNMEQDWFDVSEVAFDTDLQYRERHKVLK
jgi:hypothetical protein